MTGEVESSLAQDPLRQCGIFVEQRQIHSALTVWFQLPLEHRNELLADTLRKASYLEMLSFAKDADSCTNGERFVLQYFSTLSSPAAKKVIVPTGKVELTQEEVDELTDGFGDRGFNRFQEMRAEKGFKLDADSDTSDFPSPASVFKKFSTNEIEIFLMRLIPHLEPEPAVFRKNFLIHPIQHIDLLANPQLFPRLENSLLFESMPMKDILANLLNQGVLPKAETFEAVFKRVPKECNPDATFEVLDKEIPLSLFYFTFLLRAAGIESDNGKITASTKEPVARYLLNEEFMKRVFPYLESEDFFQAEGFENDIIPRRIPIEYGHIVVKATGEKAKRLKRDQFARVLYIALQYLQVEGDLQAAQKLKEKFMR